MIEVEDIKKGYVHQFEDADENPVFPVTVTDAVVDPNTGKTIKVTLNEEIEHTEQEFQNNEGSPSDLPDPEGSRWARFNEYERLRGDGLKYKEDLFIDSDNEVKLADRDNTDGMGYVILRKNKSFAEQVTKENTVYEIRYEFDLNNEEINIPNNCILKFTGGCIKNTIIRGNNTILEGFANFINATISGNFKNFKISYKNDNIIKLSELKKLIESNCNIIFDTESFILDIDTIESITLSKYIDFKNTKIYVINNYKNSRIFNYSNTFTQINIPKEKLNDYNINFSEYALNKNKTYLINVYDANIWTYRDNDKTDIFTRRDLLYIENGYSLNTLIKTYNNDSSNPICAISDVSNLNIGISNVYFVFDGTYSTGLLAVDGGNNIKINNVDFTINNTNADPNSLFYITNSANIIFNTCRMINSYVGSGGASYIFYINNAYNVIFDKVSSSAKTWGVMGTDNINKLTVTNSNINRIDIHCYGKSINIKRCNFNDNTKYNQFSGISDYIKFDECCFANTAAVLYEGSYKSWFEHNLIFNNCEFASNQFITLYAPNYNKSEEREELQYKCLPKLYINNSIIKNGYTHIYYITETANFDNDIYIELVNVKWTASNKEHLCLAHNKITTSNNVTILLNKTNLFYKTEQEITHNTASHWTPIAFETNNIRTNNDRQTIYIKNSIFPCIWQLNNIDFICVNSVIYGISYNRANTNTYSYKNCNLHWNTESDSTVIINPSYIKNCNLQLYNKVINVKHFSGKYQFHNCKSSVKHWHNLYTTANDTVYEDDLNGLYINNKKVSYLFNRYYDTAPGISSDINFNGNSYYNTTNNKLYLMINNIWTSIKD